MTYAPAYKHDPIQHLFGNVYWVHGSIKIGLGMTMNRNMIIVQENGKLYLINPVRLHQSEEQKLKNMGDVKAIIRLGDFHGLDDQYYLDTFQCELWCQEGQESYPVNHLHKVIDTEILPPFSEAKFFIFQNAMYPEAAIYFDKARWLITTDSIQYWSDWQHMNWAGKSVLWLMGFRKGLFIGLPWLKRVTRKGESLKGDFESLLSLEFDNLLAAHGKPLIGEASAKVKNLVSGIF